MRREVSPAASATELLLHAPRLADYSAEDPLDAGMVERTAVRTGHPSQHLTFALRVANIAAKRLLKLRKIQRHRRALIENTNQFRIEAVYLFTPLSNFFVHRYLSAPNAKAATSGRG